MNKTFKEPQWAGDPDEPAALAWIEPVATFAGKRDAPVGTSEFWGYLWEPQIIINQGTKLYSAATVEQLVRERDAARDHANRLGDQMGAEARISDAQLAALRLKCDEAISACASETCAMAQKVAAVTAERDELRKDAELANDTFAQIINWCRAYPLVVFPEPDFKKAHAVLLTAGITLDAVSASNMRHVLKGVEQIIIGAQGVAMLAKHSPEDEIERARRMV